MALVRWQPRSRWVPSTETRAWGDVGSLLDEFFDWSLGRGESRESSWIPRIDVAEETDRYVTLVDLPGMSKEDIEVTMDNDVLTITGERKFEPEKDNEVVHRRERFCGKFTRSMTFPGDVQPDKIEASFKDGVLQVIIPKSEQSKARKIEIK